MRKFFAPLILSLFFFIPFRVNATTYTYTFTESDFDFVKNNLDSAISLAENTIGNSSDYLIFNKKVNGVNTFYFSYDFASSSYPHGRFEGWDLLIYSYGSGYQYNSSFTSVSSSSFVYTFSAYMYRNSTNQFFQYSTKPVYFRPASIFGDTFVFVYGEHTYQVTDSDAIPTMKDLYDMWFSEPPTPPDNTPLLTTFYSVVIDKIGEICTFFTSNYLYLSVFVIFLFYISILLLRRFIK